MWNGTRPSLKARPDTRNTSPNTSSMRELLDSAARLVARAAMSEITSVPVAP